MIIHQNKAYQQVIAGPWTGVQETKVETAEPLHRWNGKKISADLVAEVLSFFAWSYKETRSEVVVHLWYHEEHGWKAGVLPQEGWNGMTIKLIDDHANRIPTFQRFGRGWTIMGSWHHHCSAGAFQSGTDASDERTKEGLHLTTGDLDKLTLSIHARASFRQTLTAVVLADWFEVPEVVFPAIRSQWIEYLLKTPSVAAFPDWWKENIIKIERPAYTPTWQAGGNVGYNNGNYTGGYNAAARKKGYMDGRVKSLMEQYNCTVEQIEAGFEELLSNEFSADLLSAAAYAEMEEDDIREYFAALSPSEVKGDAEEAAEMWELDAKVARLTGHTEGCVCGTCSAKYSELFNEVWDKSQHPSGN